MLFICSNSSLYKISEINKKKEKKHGQVYNVLVCVGGGEGSLPPANKRASRELDGTEKKKRGKKRDTFSFFFSKTELCGGKEKKEEKEERWGEGLENTKCIALFKVILREGYLDHFLVLNGYQ